VGDVAQRRGHTPDTADAVGRLIAADPGALLVADVDGRIGRCVKNL
jgi:hypothetical protein